MTVFALLAVFALAGSQEKVEGPNAIALPSQNPLITEGDAHYTRRQDGRVGAQANPREIALAVASYDRAAQAPDSAEARWKLARALYFQGAYTAQDADGQAAIYEKARRAGDDAIRILERRAKNRGAAPFEGRAPSDIAASVLSDRDASPTFFWAAVAWGQLLGGIALALGFLTRAAAVGIAIIMIGAIATVHWTIITSISAPRLSDTTQTTASGSTSPRASGEIAMAPPAPMLPIVTQTLSRFSASAVVMLASQPPSALW